MCSRSGTLMLSFLARFCRTALCPAIRRCDSPLATASDWSTAIGKPASSDGRTDRRTEEEGDIAAVSAACDGTLGREREEEIERTFVNESQFSAGR